MGSLIFREENEPEGGRAEATAGGLNPVNESRENSSHGVKLQQG